MDLPVLYVDGEFPSFSFKTAPWSNMLIKFLILPLISTMITPQIQNNLPLLVLGGPVIFINFFLDGRLRLSKIGLDKWPNFLKFAVKLAVT
jgi:hypothetical protein